MYLRKAIAGALVMLYSTGGMAQANTGSRITVTGTITGDLNGYDKVYLFIGHDDRDSSVIRDGHYSFSVPFKEPTYVVVLPQAVMKSKRGYRMNAVLTDMPGAYTVNVNASDPVAIPEVSGTEATNLYAAYGQQKAEMYKKISDEVYGANGRMGAVKPVPASGGQAAPAAAGSTTSAAGPATSAAISATPITGSKTDTATAARKVQMVARGGGSSQAFGKLAAQYLPSLMEKFIGEHPDSYASAFILDMDGRANLNISQQEKCYALLSDKMKASPDGKKVYDNIQGTKSSAVGRTVSDFSLEDPSGNKIDLASFKGKYVMIDFWASWCHPCRMSFPHMREVYAKYKSPSFEIYSISIDKKKEDWLKAVKQENNPWPQGLDNIDIALSGFGITGVPTTILLDPNGKIIVKEVGFNADKKGGIEEKLDSLFGGKSAMLIQR
jgi:thiol-disulfide isomerase/thioredoxin